MANTADPAWHRFEEFIKDDLAWMTPIQLAELFNDEEVTSKRIADWRRGHGRPKLAELPRLSVEWTSSDAHDGDVDELFFARMLGAVPDVQEALSHEVWLHRRVFELRTELRDLEISVRHSDTTEATGAIVAATTATQNWAVAVQPAIEGPDNFRFHVADFLDFRRVYKQANTPSVTIEDQRNHLENELHNVLNRYGAVYAPQAPTQWRSDVDGQAPKPGEAQPDQLRYSVRHTIAERSPDRQWQYKDVPSVAVVSLTDGPWPADVAAIIARMLGYGFFTTRKIAQGYRIDNSIPTSGQLDAYRTQLHAEHLRKPWPRYVWAHRSSDVVPGRFLPVPPKGRGHASQAGPLHVVWLREEPQLISNLVKGRGLSQQQEDEIRWGWGAVSKQIDALAGADAHVLVHTVDCESVGQGPDHRRGPRWQRSFVLAKQAVELILGSDYENIVEPHIAALTVRQDADPIEKCLVAWLAAAALR